MKIIIIPFLIVAFGINLNAQTKQFDDLIEFEDNGKVLIYLDGIFRIAYKDCADYYLVTEFDKQKFIFLDTVKIYRINESLYQICSYQNGRRNGLFKSFHSNGEIEFIGQYINGKRSGLWKYFYSNGQLYKTVEFKNNHEYLINFYAKNGKALVINGKGKFKDKVYYSIANSVQSTIKGKVKDGRPDGKWQLYMGGKLISTEHFENNMFKKGVSHSIVLGDTEYFDQSNSTFSGINFIEHLKIVGPSICNDKRDLFIGYDFYNRLRNKFENSKLKNDNLNCWFLIELEAGIDRIIKNVKIFSNMNENINKEISNLIYSLKQLENSSSQNAKYNFFPIVIIDSKIYLPKDEEVELLKYKY